MPRQTLAEKTLARIRAEATDARASRDAGLIYYGRPTPYYTDRAGSMSADEYDRRITAHVAAELTAPTDNAAWSAIRAEAIRLGLPRHYRTDLLIDMQACEGKFGPGYGPNVIFAWNVYDTGTNVIAAADPGKERQRLRACQVATIHRGDRSQHWYLWIPKDGRLKTVNPEAADAALDAETTRRHLAARLERQREATAQAAIYAEGRRQWYRDNVYPTSAE